MKSFLVSAAAAALIFAAPAAFADPHDHHGESHGSHGGNSQGGGSHGSSSHATTTPPTKSPHYAGSGGGGIHTPATMGTTTRYHGKVITTMSPATVYNNAVRNQNRDDYRRHRNRDNNYYGHDHNWSGRNNDYYRNRDHAHGHIDFDRRNVTARHHYRYHGGSWRWPGDYRYQRWTFGMTLPSIFWTNDYWIDDYYDYGLGAPPPGTVWVRYGNDAILIDRYTGEILEVVYDQFY